MECRDLRVHVLDIYGLFNRIRQLYRLERQRNKRRPNLV